jgi:transposase
MFERQHWQRKVQTFLGRVNSKRGNSYLRRLLIHGARSVYMHMNRERSSLGRWINELQIRAHRNVVVVAIANKIARTCWAVLTGSSVYRLGAA